MKISMSAEQTFELPEQQLTADETAALNQLYSVQEALRHSTSPAVSDFTGIGNTAGLLASLQRWHAVGEVNGLAINEQGPAGVQSWLLTYLGQMFAKAIGATKAAPAITSLSPSTASIAAAAGKPVKVKVLGTNFRPFQVVQVNGVAQTTIYVNHTELDINYTLPAASTVQFSVNDPNTSQTSGNSPFVVTA